MAFLGRESEADLRRAQRVRQWAQARNPNALAAMLFGLIAAVDWITIVLGIPCGLAAIVLGLRGLGQIRRANGQLGRRLCLTAIGLGSVGVLLSIAVWVISHRLA